MKDIQINVGPYPWCNFMPDIKIEKKKTMVNSKAKSSLWLKSNGLDVNLLEHGKSEGRGASPLASISSMVH